MISHNEARNGKREGQKSAMIGQSASKRLTVHPHDGEGSTTIPSGSRAKRPEMRGQTLEQRFSEKVSITERGCHEWTGCLAKNGYGMLHLNGVTAYAHRVAFEMAYGVIPQGAQIMHSCDNRRCVNIGHLSLGSFDENMADMVQKSRQALGERNSHAKLTEEEVKIIRSLNGTNASIAGQFKVSASLVSLIRNRRNWKHV